MKVAFRIGRDEKRSELIAIRSVLVEMTVPPQRLFSSVPACILLFDNIDSFTAYWRVTDWNSPGMLFEQ